MYNIIILGLMISVAGMLVVVFFMVNPTCIDCDSVRVLGVDDGKFTA